MSQRTFKLKMTEAVARIDEAQNAGKPIQVGKARESALIDGLMQLAELAGADLERPGGIDANGEVWVVCRRNPSTGACESGYGKSFAHFLNQIPARAGTVSVQGHVMESSSWLMVNHFDLERMIRRSVDLPPPAKTFDNEAEGPAP